MLKKSLTTWGILLILALVMEMVLLLPETRGGTGVLVWLVWLKSSTVYLALPPLLPVPPQGAAEILGLHSNPRQLMSPSPNLTQDPFQLQVPKPEADECQNRDMSSEVQRRQYIECVCAGLGAARSQRRIWVNLRRLESPTASTIKSSIFSAL